jgi:membrane protein YqaA with SNARE-associated domain
MVYSAVVEYVVLFLVVFGVNLLPAFGPPTWAVLVFFRLESGLAPVPLVLLGAVAAACGRLVLAYGARAFRGRLSEQRIESLGAVQEAIAGSRRGSLVALALFALSPLPSAQLFIAAGLLNERIVPLTLAFFVGRLVSYSLYVAAASAVKQSLGHILGQAFTSPLGIALQIVMLGLLVALLKVDWARIIMKRRNARAHSA